MRLHADDVSDPNKNVSIHASVKDATSDYFDIAIPLIVSIHASVKDATTGYNNPNGNNQRFNPRICKRCDLQCACAFRFGFVSIHASVKDATLRMVFCPEPMRFNPRICKRCDGVVLRVNILYNVSIHASVKDATVPTLGRLGKINVSIHASVKDATNPSTKCAEEPYSFNPRICKRCDIRLPPLIPLSLMFQSTHL